MDHKVSAKKPDGKWWTFGSLKTNQYGNLQLSFKNTDDFKAFVNGSGEWINFSLFEDKPKEEPITRKALDDIPEKHRPYSPSDEIPF